MIVLYLAVTYVCLRVLGVDGLAQTHTPASEVMRRALGDRGARLIALGIAVSTVGFLSQSVLTAPRVYYAMARDGVFFSAVGKLESAHARAGRRHRAAGRVGGDHRAHRQVRSDPQLRRRDRRAVLRPHRRVADHLPRARANERRPTEPVDDRIRVPGHPITTIVFVLACWAVSAVTIVQRPQSAGIGVGILLLGVSCFQFWRKPDRGAQRRADGAHC